MYSVLAFDNMIRSDTIKKSDLIPIFYLFPRRPYLIPMTVRKRTMKGFEMIEKQMYLGIGSTKLLPAPKIAGLIPATVPIQSDMPYVPVFRSFWTNGLPTPEEIDLDIAHTFQRCYARLRDAAKPSVMVEG